VKIRIPFTTRYIEIRSSLANPDKWLVEWFAGGGKAASGVTVNENTALNSTAVFACVRILAETIASLPLVVYERLESGGKQRAQGHYLYSILHDQPNPEMTSFEFRETLMGHLALWGNAYAEIERDNAGRVVGLWPLRPDKMRVMRDEQSLRYEYQLPNSGTVAVLRQQNVLHIRGLSSNGIVGYSPIRLAREAIGLALATEEFGARFFGQGSRPSGVLEHPGQLSEEAAKRLRKSWEELHSGLSNAHRIAILEEGMSWKQIGVPPEDAQFLETRKFQITEIARIYRIPPHMLADLERATFSNIEHQAIEFVVHTIRPWLVRWEQALKRDLFMPAERDIYFAEFLVDGLLRGDIESRYRAYSVGRQWGWLSANDVRELENMNPIEGGDTYLIPLNMVPAGSSSEAQGQTEGVRALPVGSEERARRAAGTRRQAAQRYERLFKEREERIVKREAGEIKKAARKYLTRRDSQQFQLWLEDFYREHREYMQKTWWPLYLTFAEEIQAYAAEEINAPIGVTPELEDFLKGYRITHVTLHAGSSEGQIRQILRDALAAGDDPLPLIEERLDEWVEKRPGKIAMRETVQASNAVAREVYRQNGIQRVRWVNFDPSCPYCDNLDGKVISIQSTFLSAGEEFQPEGAERPLVTSVNIHHPPGHEGCDCQLIASI